LTFASLFSDQITIIAMRQIYYFLLLTSLNISAAAQTSTRINCTNFPINERDSVCLDAQINIAPEEVERIISTGQKDVLLIFDGWVNWNKRLLHSGNLQNEQIVKYLKKYRIITLYVDDKVMASGKDSMTVGKKNMLYQMDRFEAVTQPYYIIIKGRKSKCSSGYMPGHEKILEFFKRCE
jgi:hypothetical protein